MKIPRRITIDIADNGFILKDSFGEDTDVTVIEGDDYDEKKNVSKLLYEINDLIGVQYDGFSAENLNIKWNKKGDEIE